MGNTNKTIFEIKKRINNYYDHSHVFGLEVKNRRFDLEMTLYNVSKNICSMSYLCKVENNKIVPNEYCVNEICNKLDIDNKTLKAINNVERNLLKLIKSYLYEEYEDIKIIFNESKSLKSYASDIIAFIYYISIKDLANATKYFNKVNNLLSSMSNNELLIVSIFEAIYFYFNQDFNSAIKILNYVDKFCFEEEIKLLSRIIRFYNLIALNSPMIGTIYNELILYLTNLSKYNLCEKINYAMAISLVRAKDYNSLDSFMNKVNNKEYISNINILKFIVRNDIESLIKYEDYNNASMYYQTCRSLILKTNYNNYSCNIYNIDEYPLLIEYLSIEDDYDKMDFITSIALDNLSLYNEKFLIDYFVKELAKLALKKQKYKALASSIFKFEDDLDEEI